MDRRESVCCIKCADGSYGSGFHYGGGWIITNSHVVGQNACDLAGSEIFFPSVTFPPSNRLCFFGRIEDSTKADRDHVDVAIFRLENCQVPPLINCGTAQVVVGDALETIHYGGNRDASYPMVSVGENVLDITQTNVGPSILRRKRVGTTGGSSGSPIFKANCLAAIHFAGNNDQAFGICWQPCLSELLGLLVSNIASAERITMLLQPEMLKACSDDKLRGSYQEHVLKSFQCLTKLNFRWPVLCILPLPTGPLVVALNTV